MVFSFVCKIHVSTGLNAILYFPLQKGHIMGKGLEQTLLQGGHTEGPETYEKMLSITSHQRDAN